MTESDKLNSFAKAVIVLNPSFESCIEAIQMLVKFALHKINFQKMTEGLYGKYSDVDVVNRMRAEKTVMAIQKATREPEEKRLWSEN